MKALELNDNCQHITVETFKYFQIFTKKEINRVNNAPKWELCAKMTKAIVFFFWSWNASKDSSFQKIKQSVKNINIFSISFL